MIGGGLPIGAFGGIEEIMRIYSPVESWQVSHSGTLNGNPITTAAGIATLEEFSGAKIDELNHHLTCMWFRNVVDAASARRSNRVLCS